MNRSLIPFIVASVIAAAEPATVDLIVEDQPLATLLLRIARDADLGIAASSDVQQRIDANVTIRAKDVPWKEALRLLRDQYHLAVTIEGSRLTIADADAELRRRAVAGWYDVRRLNHEPISALIPSLATTQPGTTGSMLLAGHEPPPQAITGLTELIRKELSDVPWIGDGIGLELQDGWLVVHHVPEVQERIAKLVATLQRIVDRRIQVIVWQLPADTAVGTWQGPAWAERWKDLTATARPVGVLLLGDGHEDCHAALTQASYVAETDVVQQVQDPIISTDSAGLVVGMRARRTIDGFLVDVRCSVATGTLAERPLQDAAGKQIGALHLPRKELATSEDSRLISAGGATILRCGDATFALVPTLLEP